jgi:cell division protein FtsB
MSMFISFRRSLRPVLAPALGVCLVGYFAYHAVQGERGLIARNHLRTEIAEAESALAELRAQRQRLEHRADLLNPEHLDIDMLEERLREVLGYGRPDELTIYVDPPAAGQP